jgi:monoamine oxidase
MTGDVDVVIVGAGAAGLSAAKEAARRGLSHVVLEASHRIGGRAYTEEFAPGQPFDLGCHWMHSASLNPFVAIADELGFAYSSTSTYQSRIWHRGAWLGEEARAELERLSESDHAAIARASQSDNALSVADVVDLDSPWQPYPAYWSSLGSSVDIDQTGVCDIAAYNDTEENWPVIRGYGALVAAWAADVPVTLNSPVERIRMTGSGVEVVSFAGTVTGRTALVTVSTNILASGMIAFEPGLPEWKQSAVLDLPLGVHNRIGIMLKDLPAAYGEGGRITVMLEDDDVPMTLEVGPYGLGHVVAVTGGRFGAWLERQGQQASVDYLTERLRAALGSDVTDLLSDRVIVTAWQGDPWTLGSYSAAKPGSHGQRAVLARPVEERIFFAGEATSQDFFSTCHGAYLSGIRAVGEIAETTRATA